MGRDAVCARYFPDQSDRLRDAFRSGERGVRGFRRIFHRHPTAARRIVPAAATLTTVAALCERRGLECDGHGPPLQQNRMGDRADYCARLESVCAERHPGFESPPIRHAKFLPAFEKLALSLIALFQDLQFLA